MSCRMVVTLFLLAAAPRLAAAHELNVFAYVDGHSIQGEVFVPGGTTIADATVTAFGPQARKLGETTTDEDGHFSLEVQVRCDHRIVVDDGGGHGAEYTVAADELPDDLAPLSTSSATASHEESAHAHPTGQGELESLRKQVIELRKDLAAFQEEIRFRDLLGGIGFILGLTGVASYFLAARRDSRRGLAS